MFRPQPNQRLPLGNHVYRFLPHPLSPTFVYGQEGRMAVVYKLQREESGAQKDPSHSARALKVFKAAYRTAQMLVKARELRPFARLPGLQACARRVIDPTYPSYRDLVSQYPDLAYAVLMPWVDGTTWSDIMLQRKPLTREQAWNLAWALVTLLTALEERQIAHCDLSGANLMVNWHPSGQAIVALVDVEQLYAPGLSPPDTLLVGSPGYTPAFRRDVLWGPLGDRFAGAVLLAEILGWYHPEVVQYGNEQSYFLADEVQKDSPRYRLLLSALAEWRPLFAQLFRQAWEAETPEQCPSFQTWQEAFWGRSPSTETRAAGPLGDMSASLSSATASTDGIPREAQPDAEPQNAHGGPTASPSFPPSSRKEVSPSTATPPETDVETARATELFTEEVTTQTELEEDMAHQGEEDAPAPPIATEVQTDVTQMVPPVEDINSLTLPSFPQEPLWRTRIQRARRAAQASLVEQALQEYQQAIDEAAHQAPDVLPSLISEYNQLIFRQIHLLQDQVYGPHFSPASARSLAWSHRVGRWLAGLSTLQLGLILGGVALGAFGFMAAVASLTHDPTWATLSPGSIMLALLMGLFPRSPLVVMGLFSGAVMFGILGMAVRNTETETLQVLPPVLTAAIGAGLSSWLWAQFTFSEPQSPSGKHGIWVVVTSVLIGFLVDDLTYGGWLKVFDIFAYFLNALLALGAWYLGLHLQQILIAYREALR